MMSPQETNTVDINTRKKQVINMPQRKKKNNSPNFKDYFSFSKHKGDSLLLADS